MLGKETHEQLALFEWIRLHPKIAPYAMHIANERKSSPQYGALLKRMGVRAGVSDIFVAIASPCGNYHGLWIELKAGKNKPTTSQLQFIADMINQGYCAKVCYGAEESIKVIKEYLNI